MTRTPKPKSLVPIVTRKLMLMKHTAKADYANPVMKDYRRFEQMRIERICKNCWHLSQNTGFTKYAGKPIGKNICTLSGRRLITDPPRVVNPNTKCELSFDLFKPKKDLIK